MSGRHFLLYGHGGAYNHGGEAITKCTIDLLRECVPDCYITLSTHFPEQDKQFGLLPDEIVTRKFPASNNYEMYQDTLARVTSRTTAIQVGGDNYCYKNWQRYAQIHQKAKECGGKSILWGCSIDENVIDSEMLEILKSHDLILAREVITFRTLKALGLTNVLKVSDIAFTLKPKKINFETENYVVFNVSPLVCRKNPVMLQAAKNLIDVILKTTDYNIILLPHVLMPTDNDLDILETIAHEKKNERIRLLFEHLSAAEYKYVISKAELCIAARTHVTIAAYSSCVPTLAIGYSTKAKGIADDLNLEEYVIDVEEDKLQQKLEEQFLKLYKNKRQLKEQLKGKIPQYIQNTTPQKLLDFLKEDMR